ncbi:hypothetical protein [Cognatilysobacter bugurensis]|uniref:Secreted protein n=1 Tax=Cognatilysobacter bugurensis TaxID=543356 RepID=A0A918T1Q8_9GAMM|nr:hypothetical protein [Lysobacter bugurensis]GHA81084.1 hypothetical protein GCM10007067_19020 [Lysobacter bugurensis]
MSAQTRRCSHDVCSTGRARFVAVAFVAWCGVAVGPAWAAPPAAATPEIVRPDATAQDPGVAHTLRTIPEACARLEGRFTGDAAQPYAFAAARSRPNCQPRARLVDASKVKPSVASGWVFNDEIRVPNAACPAQRAVVRVWHKAVDVSPPKLDAQGRARLYLQDAQKAAQADQVAAVPQFAAQVVVEGKCS